MKKSIFLFGLLTTALCLSACGSKEFDMSFEEALEVANHSTLQEALANSDAFEQAFDIAWSIDYDWNKVDATISSEWKENTKNNNSESSINLDVNVSSEEFNLKAKWSLDLKTADDTIYLNLSALDLEWDESVSSLAMMTEWFKNHWFFISLSGLAEIPSSLSIIKDTDELNEKTKEMIINDWSIVYNWKFENFNWYNARKFSIDNDKLNALIKEYYATLNNGEEVEDIPELNITDFEWYLVITWKDKVATVIEKMVISEDDINLNINGFDEEDFELYVSTDEEEVISFKANKDWSKYNISAIVPNLVELKWTLSPKISSNSIDLKFDATLTIKSEDEEQADVVIPFKGSYKYKSISEFTITAPEDAEDLSETIWASLGLLWGDYDYEDYEDYDYEDYEDEDTITLYEGLNPEEENNAEPQQVEVWEIVVEENN